jgi:hypothetical protein
MTTVFTGCQIFLRCGAIPYSISGRAHRLIQILNLRDFGKTHRSGCRGIDIKPANALYEQNGA